MLALASGDAFEPVPSWIVTRRLGLLPGAEPGRFTFADLSDRAHLHALEAMLQPSGGPSN